MSNETIPITSLQREEIEKLATELMRAIALKAGVSDPENDRIITEMRLDEAVTLAFIKWGDLEKIRSYVEYVKLKMLFE